MIIFINCIFIDPIVSIILINLNDFELNYVVTNVGFVILVIF